MNYRSARALLQLEDGTELTRTGLRRIYLRRLRDFPPERDPEGFRALREAFELMRTYASDDPEPIAIAEPSAVMTEASRVVEAVADVAVAAKAPVVERPSVTPIAAPPIVESPVLAPPIIKPPIVESPVLAPPIIKPPIVEPPIIKPVIEPPVIEPPVVAPPVIEVLVIEAPAPPPPAIEVLVVEVSPPVTEPPAPPPDKPKFLFDDGLRPNLPPLAPVPVPVVPPPPLPVLVSKLLAMLETGDAAAAVALAAAWMGQTYADDFRDANTQVAIRWALTRELLEIAVQLPKPVVCALAKALIIDNLASARPSLDAYRVAHPKEAGDANALIATRATSLYEDIKGTLFIPGPLPMSVLFPGGFKLPELPKFTLPPPPRRSGSGALGGLVGVIFIFLIAGYFASSGTGHSKYEPKIPNFHFEPIKMPQIPQIDFSTWFVPPPWPKLIMRADQPYDLWHQMTESSQVLQKYEISSPEQKAAAAELEALLDNQKCPAVRAAVEKLEQAPLTTKPGRALYATQHIKAIRDRLDDVCPKKPAKPDKPKPKPEKHT